jgi:hypothetical protein
MAQQQILINNNGSAPASVETRLSIKNSAQLSVNTKTNKAPIFKLSRSLIVHISKILLGTNNDKIDKKAMLTLVYTFTSCRKYYVGPDGIFKLQHYLWLYSKKYHDVRLLAHKYSLPVEKKVKISKMKYSVTSIHHTSIHDSHIGIFKTKGSGRVCDVFAYNFEKGRNTRAFPDTNVILLQDHYLTYWIDGTQFNELRTWECILFDESILEHFMCNQNIEMSTNITGTIRIDPSLTLDIFKKLVNERERQQIFQ